MCDVLTDEQIYDAKTALDHGAELTGCYQPDNKPKCEHTTVMILASEKRKLCYDCGAYFKLDNNPMSKHTR